MGAAKDEAVASGDGGARSSPAAATGGATNTQNPVQPSVEDARPIEDIESILGAKRDDHTSELLLYVKWHVSFLSTTTTITAPSPTNKKKKIS